MIHCEYRDRASGKTTELCDIAKRHAIQDREVLYITYNNNSKKDIHQKLGSRINVISPDYIRSSLLGCRYDTILVDEFDLLSQEEQYNITDYYSSHPYIEIYCFSTKVRKPNLIEMYHLEQGK